MEESVLEKHILYTFSDLIRVAAAVCPSGYVRRVMHNNPTSLNGSTRVITSNSASMQFGSK